MLPMDQDDAPPYLDNQVSNASDASKSSPARSFARTNSIVIGKDIDAENATDSYDLDMPEEVPFQELPFFPRYQGLRLFIYILFSDPTASIASLIISAVITLMIVASCATFVLESMPEYKFPTVGTKEDDTYHAFTEFELFAIVLFTVEYGLRLLTAHAVPCHLLGKVEEEDIAESRFHPIVVKTWVFFKQPFNLIDFLSILPWHVSHISQKNDTVNQLSFLRILRLLRVFRVFKLGKYSEGVVLYAEVFRKSGQAIYLLMFFSLLTSVVMGSFVYMFEKGDFVTGGCVDHHTGEARDCFMRDNIYNTKREESPFYSIPQAIWWVFTTITTVGYGDIYPTSYEGKGIAIITMHAGILGLALPISIIGTNFREIFEFRQKAKHDQKIRSRLSGSPALELMNEMKASLELIVEETKKLQATMKHYEDVVIGERYDQQPTMNHVQQGQKLRNTLSQWMKNKKRARESTKISPNPKSQSESRSDRVEMVASKSKYGGKDKRQGHGHGQAKLDVDSESENALNKMIRDFQNDEIDTESP